MCFLEHEHYFAFGSRFHEIHVIRKSITRTRTLKGGGFGHTHTYVCRTCIWYFERSLENPKKTNDTHIPSEVLSLIVACCILHNIVLDRNNIKVYEGLVLWGHHDEGYTEIVDRTAL